MTWIYIGGGTVLALVLAKLALVSLGPMGGVEMPGGETDMMQFHTRERRPKAHPRRWRIKIERD